ncbi:hypothetical protein BpHYR1_033583 [Brachionus plicatilis]|uniref:Uncharacterized protein n=1 Tax=Brachionus plicatilis TaxID=10195 RepID=A0A3M7RJ62_BRAPC|nr:hypothetical protein BpHYR1_033583 [Brachionus plicatilis]
MENYKKQVKLQNCCLVSFDQKTKVAADKLVESIKTILSTNEFASIVQVGNTGLLKLGQYILITLPSTTHRLTKHLYMMTKNTGCYQQLNLCRSVTIVATKKKRIHYDSILKSSLVATRCIKRRNLRFFQNQP